MKKVLVLLYAALTVLVLCGCSPDSASSGYSSNNSSYDYDSGYGYDAPSEGQSFSDYVKEQEPDLYETMTDIYDSATSGYSNSYSSDDYDYDKGYGYTAPKEGQSFSDYVKEQDPELYASLFG